MLRVFFTPQLQRFLDAPAREVEADTARQALDAVFHDNPRLRGYVLDERGALRKHVTVFLGAQRLREEEQLDEALPPGTEVSVLQALSGG